MLPAVEAMALLARRVRAGDPGRQIHTLEQARFAKFLAIDPALITMEALYELTLDEQNRLRAARVTKTTSKTGTISRYIEHAGMIFSNRPDSGPHWPMDLAAALTGLRYLVAPERLYDELVPFGPHFQTICSPLALTEDGAMALVRAPDHPGITPDPDQGSPHPLDGAFHGACVWGQRHAGVVAFPVGIERRTIFAPTRAGETYLARILPLKRPGPALGFDIVIMDLDGRIREAAWGVEMRDVSHGRWRPPAWITPDAPGLTADDLWPGMCEGMVILERAGMADFANLALSPTEANRLADMDTKHRQGYLSDRLACKRLWRKLTGDGHTPAPDIETTANGGPQPTLPTAAAGLGPYSCAVAHDERFTIAVAGTAPLGVDVEKITSRAYQHRRLFMRPSEQTLQLPESVDDSEAALRIRSTKEAAAKILNMTLADAWKQIEVVALEEGFSRVRYNSGPITCARHGRVHGHLFTLVTGLG